MGVYSVLGTAEDGCGVVLTLIPCAMAANTKKTGAKALFWFITAFWNCPCTVRRERFLQSSQDNNNWIFASLLGASLEQGSATPRLPYPPVTTMQPSLTFRSLQMYRLGLCLAQTSWEKPQWQDFIPSKLFSIWTAGWQPRISQEWAECLNFPWSMLDFCRHLMTQFLPDSTKRVMKLTRRNVTSSETGATYRWPHHTYPIAHLIRSTHSL
jgi:hypothetical protein